jgi:pimeloyl-ACP methyl ester carboxylesterase
MDSRNQPESFATRPTGNSQRDIVMEMGRLRLHGNLSIPRAARGLVLFAHGSGSSRFSPRNRYVAEALNQSGFATCLFDLLTLDEEQEDQLTRAFRFNIGLLAERLVQVTDWMQRHFDPADSAMPGDFSVGYFGASTGAAAALIAAADRPQLVGAIVSRGGRPDLAARALRQVQAPTLLLVGEWDEEVIRLNREAYRQLPDPRKELAIIPGATHLFEEPGKLEQVAEYAAQWFENYLV